MSRKDDNLYLGHMLDTARKVTAKMHGQTRATFDSDENLRLAVLHLVQTIGEAARQVSETGRTAHPEIPWHAITGMRHRIVHDYLNVSYDVLWDVLTRNLPPLLAALEDIRPPEDV